MHFNVLHFGLDVEVLSPESVRDEMKKLIDEMADMYKQATSPGKPAPNR